MKKKLILTLFILLLLLYKALTANIFDFSIGEDEPQTPQNRDSLALIYTNFLSFQQPDLLPDGFSDPFPQVAVNPLQKYAKDSVLFKIDGERYKEGSELDSSGRFMIIYERLFEENFSQTSVMTLDDYAKARLKHENKKIWRAEIAKNTGGRESGDLFDEFSLDIPFKIKSKTFHRVFGSDKIGLKASGYLSISAIYKNYSMESAATKNLEDNSSSDFQFKNSQDFSISGRIGSKVDVNIAQSTERSDYENVLKITYTGESDEVIEKLEAGNISLSLPGTEFATFSGTNKGLFGVKTDLKLGNFKSTFIASLEKGESSELNIDGSAVTQSQPIIASRYARMKRLFIDETYRQSYIDNKNFEFRMDPQNPNFVYNFIGTDKISKNFFSLYLTTSAINVKDKAYIVKNARHTGENTTGLDADTNKVDKNPRNIILLKEGVDYELDVRGWITMTGTSVPTGEYLAACFKKDNENPDISYGYNKDGTYILQVLGKEGQPLQDTTAWTKLEWRNVYNLGSTDIDLTGFSLAITRNGEASFSGERPATYNNIYDAVLKKDRNTLNTNLIDVSKGLFVFPDPLPFSPSTDSSSIKKYYRDPVKFKDLLDSNIYYSNNLNNPSPFTLDFKFKSRSSTHNLGFNVLEGSEVVMSGSEKLVKDTHYSIDYMTGQLSITDPAYLNKSISIKYQRASFFQLDQKVLLGNRWQYDFGDNAFLGLSLIYFSKSLRDKRIHVGYEPINNFVWDVNGLYTFDAPYLTKAADLLPLIQTDKESKIKFEGEIAQIIPNPNPLDRAYIDDFENSERKRSLGLSEGVWSPASTPDNFFDSTAVYVAEPDRINLHDSIKTNLKSYFLKTADTGNSLDSTGFYWFNYKDSDGKRKKYKDIYVTAGQNIPTETQDQFVNTLNFGFNPKANSIALTGTDINVKPYLWNGVMRYLTAAYLRDFREMKYIELVVNTQNKPIDMFIDLGSLSEDVIPNNLLNTEKISNGETDKTNDWGIDGLDQDDSDQEYIKLISNSTLSQEPYAFRSWDDYNKDNDHQKNRPEGNGEIDTEDLNGNGEVDNKESSSISAYRFKVNPAIPNPASGIVTTKLNGDWKLIRIPLNKTVDTLGYAPDLKEIKYVKLWFAGATERTDIEIAALDIVGNEWVAEDRFKDFVEAKVLTTESPNLYDKPNEIEMEDEQSKETALQVSINLKAPRKTAYVSKTLFDAENYMNYRTMKMFVFGGKDTEDNTFNTEENKKWSFFYRFGTDSNNFYQYTSELAARWGTGNENMMELQIDSLTNLKVQRNNHFNAILESDPDSVKANFYEKILPHAKFKRKVAVKGNPSLQAVKFFNAGIVYTGPPTTSPQDFNSGFLLNDIYLKSVRKNNALAMRAAVSLNIADLATVTAGIRKIDGDFHHVEKNFGDGNNVLSFDIATATNVDKLFPSRWGLAIPFNYTYTNSTTFTKFQTNTDILVDEKNIPDSVKTKSVSEIFSYSFKKSSKSSNNFLKYSIDNLSYSGSTKLTSGSSTSTISNENQNYDNSINYSLNMPSVWFTLPAFSWTKDMESLRHLANENLTYFPSNYTFSISTNQSHSGSLTRKNVRNDNYAFTVNRGFKTELNPFSILSTKYTLDLGSDMYIKRHNLLDTTIYKQPNSGLANPYYFWNKEDTKNPVIFTHTPGLRGYERLFMLDFGELSSWKSTFSTTLIFDLTKWTSYNFSHGTTYNWDAHLTTAESYRSLTNSYNFSASTRLKAKEIFTSLDGTFNEWFPPKIEPAEKTGIQPEGATADSVQTANLSAGKENQETEPELTERGGRRSIKRTDKKSSGFSFSFNALPYLKDHLNDINLSFNTYRGSSLFKGVGLEQADLAYQLAFSRIPENFREGDMTWNGGFGWDVSTGLNLMKNVNITGLKYNFTRKYTDDSRYLNGSDGETQFVIPFLVKHEAVNAFDNACLPLPDYSVSYSGLKELLKLEETLNSLELTHGKFSSRSEVWFISNSNAYSLNALNLPGINKNDKSIYKISSKDYKLSFTPVVGLSMQFKNNVSFSTQFDYEFLMTETYNPQYEDKISSGSKKASQTLKATAGYNQRGGFQTPINFWPFSGKKLDNDINYSLSTSYTRTRNYVLETDKSKYEAEDRGTETSTIAFSPAITYKLSKNIDGSFNYSYSNTYKKDSDQQDETSSNQTMELKITMRIASK